MVLRRLIVLYRRAWNRISKASDGVITSTLWNWTASLQWLAERCLALIVGDEREKLVTWTTNLCFGSFPAADLPLKPSSLSRPLFWCFISSVLTRYDLDCKSDNLSKHVSVSFTSAVQQSVVHSWKYYTAKCLPFHYNSSLIWIWMSEVRVV